MGKKRRGRKKSKGFGATRKVGKKTYTKRTVTSKKSAAKKAAKNLRKKGNNCTISKGKNQSGKSAYAVYCRKKGR